MIARVRGISSTRTRTIDKPFKWVDPNGNSIVIPFGAQATGSLDFDILKTGYLWSFHHTDKIEPGMGIGLHVTRLELGLDTSTTIPAIRSAKIVDTTVALPVISLTLKYPVTPGFHWYVKSETIVLTFDNWTGI